MLRLNNITKDYTVAGQAVPALKGVSVNFRENEFVSILGPSGCGKTTLLNIIGGLDKYSGGDLVIDGRSTKDFGDRDWDVYRNHRIGFIFQSYNLIPHQTVLGNVELALTISGVSKAERRERAEAALIRVGLGDQLNKRPNQLSGGQCQRVAIARALVNDPEILLADEPTGALDTKTSVQIMDLMKEIAGERLVVMVTHNPELAEQYSTRIISLRDGVVVNDTMPYSDGEEMAECERRAQRKAETEAEAAAEAQTDGGKTAVKKREKAKMGMLAALALSMRNLIAKKGRTIMVGIAGSIGIIGVAIVLAFSSGISGYIYNMETDMLSGYPVTVSEAAVDYAQLLSMTMNVSGEDKSGREPDKIYVNKVVEAMTSLSGSMVSNNITTDYIDYIKDMPKEYYEVIQYSYGINFANNIYTRYDFEEDGVLDADGNVMESRDISVTGIRSIFSGVLGEIKEYANYTSIIGNIATFDEVPDSKDYILSQYDVVAGEYPSENDKNALVLALSPDKEINDLTLAQFGYVSAREFVNYAFSLAKENDGSYNDYYMPDKPHMDTPYEYTEFIGENAKTFTWYPNSAVFTKSSGIYGDTYTYNTYSDGFDGEFAVPLSVKCILMPKEGVQYGTLSSGMYYTKALTDYVLGMEANDETASEIVKDARASVGQRKGVSNVTYSYEYYYDKVNDDYDPDDPDSQKIIRNKKASVESGFGSSTSNTALSSIAATLSREDFVKALSTMIQTGIDMGMDAAMIFINQFADVIYGSSNKMVYLSELGGADMPVSMAFYTDDFNRKEDITDYLDKWNEGKEEADKIQYTDMLGVIMTMVNQLITMVTAALVAFTSIALVVSTVMIGIITYVSVVERTKEIGVIRAMGGSKRDIKHLFNAETFIIGLFAGLIGIVVTYLLSLVANLIIGGFTGIYTIAALPFWQALIMVTLSVCLTLISGLIPASKAAKKDPVVALRTE